MPEMGGVIPGSARSSTPLTHLGKSRPKRPKSRAPSRGAVVAASPAATDESLASSFFHSPIMVTIYSRGVFLTLILSPVEHLVLILLEFLEFLVEFFQTLLEFLFKIA